VIWMMIIIRYCYNKSYPLAPILIKYHKSCVPSCVGTGIQVSVYGNTKHGSVANARVHILMFDT